MRQILFGPDSRPHAQAAGQAHMTAVGQLDRRRARPMLPVLCGCPHAITANLRPGAAHSASPTSIARMPSIAVLGGRG